MHTPYGTGVDVRGTTRKGPTCGEWTRLVVMFAATLPRDLPVIAGVASKQGQLPVISGPAGGAEPPRLPPPRRPGGPGRAVSKAPARFGDGLPDPLLCSQERRGGPALCGPAGPVLLGGEAYSDRTIL